MKILIVDDTPKNVQLVANLLNSYDTAFALSGEQALEMIQEDSFDLILLDVMMPGIDGYETCSRLRKIDAYDKVPVIFLTAKSDNESILKGFDVGGQDFVTKPFNTKELLSRVNTFLKLKSFEDEQQIKIDEAVSELKTLNKEIVDTQKEVIFTMGAIGESRSKETGLHVKRVAEYSYLFAVLLGVPDEDAQLMKMASPMHDIGKVAIPDSILNKPAKLDKDEWEIMQTHSLLGYEMLKYSQRPILSLAADIALYHHEKYDGSGYPNALKGEEIKLCGRITALADVFDALGSERCYKKAWEDEKVFELLKSERGKHFDPVLVDLFFDNLDAFLEIRDKYKD
ncbi:MAG: two-component system response regulator [Epsilonproteobacteria bacterium]|nr:MAG: two-component system response regulator [Campylobacterota bacterium]